MTEDPNTQPYQQDKENDTMTETVVTISRETVRRALADMGYTLSAVSTSHTGHVMQEAFCWSAAVNEMGQVYRLLAGIVAEVGRVAAENGDDVWEATKTVRHMAARTQTTLWGNQIVAHWPGYNLHN